MWLRKPSKIEEKWDNGCRGGWAVESECVKRNLEERPDQKGKQGTIVGQNKKNILKSQYAKIKTIVERKEQNQKI